MIYLGAKRTNIDSIAGIWKTELHDFLFKKREKERNKCKGLDGSKVDTYFKKMESDVDFYLANKVIDATDKTWISAELQYFKVNFEIIILADKNGLEKEKNLFVARAKGASDKAKACYQLLMEKLYDAFTQQTSGGGKTRSHQFFNRMKITTCPYCNMQYTFTLDCDKGKTAPEYDHFHDKSDYPVLAVSFYNLVPSCHVCNHIKGIKKTVTVNPYFAGFESRFVFVDDKDVSKVLTKAEVMKRGGGRMLLRKIDGKESNDDKGNIETFALNVLYAMHDKYISEIVEKVPMYDDIYSDLATTFQTKAKTAQEVYDFVWGKHLTEAEYEDRPLSKLTKDILDQLEIKR